MPAPRLVLASASPARLSTLRRAGFSPEVVVSGVDESGVDAGSPSATALALARRKAITVADRLDAARDSERRAGASATVVLGCDSMLELDGEELGKPRDSAQARECWLRMRGREGTLHTGHALVLLRRGARELRAATASTVVRFAPLSDDEVDAYVATGEPLAVAGAFTVDGLGGPFVEAVDGDYHNVVGVSLPLLRRLLGELGIPVPSLWSPRPPVAVVAPAPSSGTLRG